MKKKGFTLVELLAVIVILAVIALIATPLIMNVINDAKENSVKRSVEQIQNMVETTYAAELIKNPAYIFNQTDVKYKGEQYTDIKMGVNANGDASVAIYKEKKCFYALDGTIEVKTEDITKDTCLSKVGTPASDTLVTDIELSDTDISLTGVGNSKVVTATVLPENATNKTLNWISSNATNISVVDGTIKCLISGKSETITVSTTDGSNILKEISVYCDGSSGGNHSGGFGN